MIIISLIVFKTTNDGLNESNDNSMFTSPEILVESDNPNDEGSTEKFKEDKEKQSDSNSNDNSHGLSKSFNSKDDKKNNSSNDKKDSDKQGKQSIDEGEDDNNSEGVETPIIPIE